MCLIVVPFHWNGIRFTKLFWGLKKKEEEKSSLGAFRVIQLWLRLVKITSKNPFFWRVFPLFRTKIQAWHFFALNNLIISTSSSLPFHLTFSHSCIISFSISVVILISQFIWWLSFNIWCYIFSINIIPSDYGLKLQRKKFSSHSIEAQRIIVFGIQFNFSTSWYDKNDKRRRNRKLEGEG